MFSVLVKKEACSMTVPLKATTNPAQNARHSSVWTAEKQATVGRLGKETRAGSVPEPVTSSCFFPPFLYLPVWS